MVTRLSLLAACFVVTSMANAQETNPAASKWVPQRSPIISLDSVCVAQISKDRKSIRFQWPHYDVETRTRSVIVELLRPEVRTRETTVNGKVIKTNYTVQVPYTETREVAYEVQVVNGVHKQDFPIESIRAWTLTGRQINGPTLAVRLVFPVHLFAWTVPRDETFESLDPYFASVMQKDTLVLYIDPQESQESGQGEVTTDTSTLEPASAAPAPAAP
jgi:hypothetical protein